MKMGDKIRFHRQRKHLTLDEVASKVGVSRQTMSRYETGVINNIPSDKLEKIAEVLDITPAYIMGWEESGGLPANVLPIPKTKMVPRVGEIACGEPILAKENLEGYDEVPEYVKCDFTLICKGDSMINARIFDGDVVCIRQQPEVESGEIAAVLIDGEFEKEATLKRVKIFPDHIVLEPENPNYRPFVFWDKEVEKVHILGKATHFISSVK